MGSDLNELIGREGTSSEAQEEGAAIGLGRRSIKIPKLPRSRSGRCIMLARSLCRGHRRCPVRAWVTTVLGSPVWEVVFGHVTEPGSHCPRFRRVLVAQRGHLLTPRSHVNGNLQTGRMAKGSDLAIAKVAHFFPFHTNCNWALRRPQSPDARVRPAVCTGSSPRRARMRSATSYARGGPGNRSSRHAQRALQRRPASSRRPPATTAVRDRRLPRPGSGRRQRFPDGPGRSRSTSALLRSSSTRWPA